MEANMSHGGLIPNGNPYGGFDLQQQTRIHHQAHQPSTRNQHQRHARQGSCVHPAVQDSFPLTMGTGPHSEQSISLAEFGRGDKSKKSTSDDDEPSLNEEAVDGHNDGNKTKKGSTWQRVKWTDKMVKLLINAVSYIGEDVGSDCGNGGRRKFVAMQKKGKWKSISKVMAERGYHVSPQQCEDKFNDLNKRYKKLNDMLGRGTSCKVVENPALLDMINYLSDKEKDEVRKILSSKHLFYESMCSYHNGNRLHLPHDQALQRSMQAALRSRDDHDSGDIRRNRHDDLDEDDQDVETDDQDDLEENRLSHADSRMIYEGLPGFMKKVGQCQDQEDFTFENPFNSQEYDKVSYSHMQTSQADTSQVLSESMRGAWLSKHWMESRSLQLEEQKLQIQVEMLELEKQRLKWMKFSKKRDHEFEKMRMENERMKLENEQMALKLKQKEIELGSK